MCFPSVARTVKRISIRKYNMKSRSPMLVGIELAEDAYGYLSFMTGGMQQNSS